MTKSIVNKRLGKVIQGYVSMFDIEDITVFEGDKVWFSGSIEKWYASANDVSLLMLRKKLEKTVVQKSINHNNRRVFIFIEKSDM